MYELVGVTKRYSKNRNNVVDAMREVNITIDEGEWLAVRGQTGHGKSTLLQILGGLDRPTTGSVKLDGTDLGKMREGQLTNLRATSIGFIFQTYNLIPTLTAQDNVEAALVPLGIVPAERRRRAAAALDSVGLGKRSHHLPSELSGGQQQRVAIARAVVKQPKVLLADEPTGNLDEGTRDEIISLLEKLWRKHDLTFVLVTHDADLAARAERVAVMKNGRLSIRSDADAPPPTSQPGRPAQRAPKRRSGTKRRRGR